MPDTDATSKRTSGARKAPNVWTDEERAAMQESARERTARSRRDPGDERAEGGQEVRAKIAELPEPDRAMAERLHTLVTECAPNLVPRTYYGMPAYAKDGNVVCFFQSSHKFKARYATLGFSDKANLDENTMWPVAFALKRLTATDEVTIGALVKKAVS